MKRDIDRVIDTTFEDRLENKQKIESEEKAKKNLEVRKKVIGISQPFKKCIETIFELASYGHDMLICGETGTGKTFLAKLAHETHEISAINGRSGEFIKADLASAATNDLLLSDLFGHVKGAFTGAVQSRKGFFEVAQNGTILLDEIGILSITEQQKLLGVLQDKKFTPIGGTKIIETNALIISATNINITKAVKQRAFRKDLYYRLKTFTIHLPSLKDRPSDIPILVDHFLKETNTENSPAAERELAISTKALELLLQYKWPGNVRELESVIKNAAFFCKNSTISCRNIESALGQDFIPIKNARVSTLESANVEKTELETTEKSEKTIEDNFLELKGAKEFKQDFPGITLGVSTMEALELYVRAGHIIVHLDETNWVKAKAAKLMGISVNNLYIRIRNLREKDCDLSKKENFEDFPRPNAKIGMPIDNFVADAKKRFLELVYRYALGNIDEILKLTGMRRHAFLFQAKKHALRAHHIIKPSDKETYTRRNAPLEQCSAEKLVEDQAIKIKSLKEKLFSLQEEYKTLQEEYSVEKDELEQTNRNLKKTLSENVISNFETIKRLEKEQCVAREKKEKAETALIDLKKQVRSLIK